MERSAKDLTELEKWDLNAKEIKNSIKIVRNWCVIRNLKLCPERLESGIRSTAPLATRLDEGDREDEMAPGAKRKGGN